MKCPDCGRNQRKSVSMVCASCGYRFVLRPGVDWLSDRTLLSAVRKTSAADTRYFTIHQLYATIYRMKRPGAKGMTISAFIAIAAAVAAMVTGLDILFGLLAGGAAIVALAFLYLRSNPNVPSLAKLRTSIDRAREAMPERFGKLLVEPTLTEPPPEWPEQDIYNYGVERILFVERPLLVDLFVRNGWHAENNALVLSADGYPNYLKSRAKDLLAENPGLSIYLLHDATSDAARLSDDIRARFQLGDREIHDLGLAPEDAKRFKGLRRASEDNSVPLDLLPYGALGSAAGAAILTGVLLSEALNQQARSISASPEAYSSYG